MKEIRPNDLSYPSSFFIMFSRSIQIYRSSAFNYLLLSFIVYLPFSVIEQLGRSGLSASVEIIHGSFLDMLVFLSLPTLIIYKKIYPIGTIRIFLLRFFASAVILSIFQLLLYFLGILGFIPYIFIMFSGFFLIIENSPKILNIKRCLMQSISAVRNFVVPISWSYLLITVLITLPVSAFAMWYFSDHQKLWQSIGELDSVRESNTVSIQQLIEAALLLMQEPNFVLGRSILHIAFRPLKSIFVAVLFVSVMYRLDPIRIDSFLSIKSNDSPSESLPESL